MTTEQLILIVDDEPINLDLLEVALTRRGYAVERAADGLQALEIARRERPTVIVTDILMPNMDGYQLCREIKSDKRLASIPIVFYSATYTDPEDQDFAIQLGGSRFVVKPADPEEFLAVLDQVLYEQKEIGFVEPVGPPPDETTFLSTYNRRLVSKLEKKINDLDRSGQLLEQQVVRAQDAENEIRHNVYVDQLTGLPTRVSLLEELQQDLTPFSEGFGLLHIDVDSYREINYAIGHDKGNLLLKAIAVRIDHAAPELVSRIARIGGHEFAVVVDGPRDSDRLIQIAKDFRGAFDRPFEIEGLTVDVTVSVGIAVCPEHADNPELLLRHAAVALRDARTTRGLVAVYDADDDPFEPGRVQLISGIRQAIRENRLVVHFQPKINLLQGVTVGLEALIRWNHPEHGILQPDVFIGLAEQTGLVRPLGRWLFKEVLRDQKLLTEAGHDLEVSINLSTRNLMDSTLPDQFMEEVAVQGLGRPRVTLEITENSILSDPRRAQTTLERMSGLGVETAIDDFGTGFSSLSHLKLLPVQELKIDRSFIMDMTDRDQDVQIVRSIINLAHALDLRVTAEGVETEGSLERLIGLGCDRAQGFFMARPMPMDALRIWLRDSPWRPKK